MLTYFCSVTFPCAVKAEQMPPSVGGDGPVGRGRGWPGAREPWVWDKWPSEGPLNYEADQREGPWDVQWCGAGGENQIKHHLFSEAGRLNRTSQETHLWRRRGAGSQMSGSRRLGVQICVQFSQWHASKKKKLAGIL